jgi:TP901 family phage tail tape measure protein
MSDQGKTQIQLPLSPGSIESLRKYAAELKQIKGDVKNVSDLLKGLKLQEIARGRGGLGAFTDGSNTAMTNQVNQVKVLSTELGKQMAMMQQYTRLASQGDKYFKNLVSYRQAENYQILKNFKGIAKINDLSQAQNKLQALKLRMGKDLLEQDAISVRRAERMIRVLERRVQLIKQEQIERAKAAKAAEREAAKPSDDQIAERQRSMSMKRLFGDGGASLFAVQAGVMANYAIMNTVQQAFSQAASFATDLDAALRNLQAITVTTDNDLTRLKDSLIDISEQTKFTAVEIAEAAVVLGQAGLSIRQIEDAMPAVALLATATGTDLAKAVDVATAALGVFRLESSQMGAVANTMTAAVNQSKLNIEKLTLGLQYAGNTAAQSGLRLEELTAAFGAMSNAGIRSGSTLGTGMRQILISLQKPSEAFQERLSELGLTMADVDVRSNGLYGVLKNLRDAGFSSADAIASFEVRASAAFNALGSNLDQVLEMETNLNNSTAAADANETQMRSLSNQAKRFGSVLYSVIEIGLEPFVLALRDALKTGGDFLQGLREYEGTIRLVTGSLASLTAAIVLIVPLRLLKGLATMAGLFKGVSAAATGVTAGVAATSAGMAGSALAVGRLSGVLRVLGVVARGFLGPWGLVATAALTGVTAFAAMGRETKTLSQTLDRSKTSFDRAQGALDETSEKIVHLDKEVQSLQDRYDSLADDRLLNNAQERIKSQFAGIGVEIEKVDSGLDGMIAALGDLREELTEEYLIRVRLAQEKLQTNAEAQKQTTDESRDRIDTSLATASQLLVKHDMIIPTEVLELIGTLRTATDSAEISGALARLEAYMADNFVNENTPQDQRRPVYQGGLDLAQSLGGVRNDPSLSVLRKALTGLVEEATEIAGEISKGVIAEKANERKDRELKQSRARVEYNQDDQVDAANVFMQEMGKDTSSKSAALQKSDLSIQEKAADAREFIALTSEAIEANRQMLGERLDLNEDFVKETLVELDNLERDIATRLRDVLEAATAENSALRDERMSVLQQKLGEVGSEIEKSVDPKEITRLLSQQQKLSEELLQLRIDTLDAEIGSGDLSPAVADEKRKALEAASEATYAELKTQLATLEERDKKSVLEDRKAGIEAFIQGLAARRQTASDRGDMGAADALAAFEKFQLDLMSQVEKDLLALDDNLTEQERGTAANAIQRQLLESQRKVDQAVAAVAEELREEQKKTQSKRDQERVQAIRASLQQQLSQVLSQLGDAGSEDDLQQMVSEAHAIRAQMLEMEINQIFSGDEDIETKLKLAETLRSQVNAANKNTTDRLKEFGISEEGFNLQAEQAVLEAQRGEIDRERAKANTLELLAELEAAEKAIVEQLALINQRKFELENPNATSAQLGLQEVTQQNFIAEQNLGIEGATQDRADSLEDERVEAQNQRISDLRAAMAREKDKLSRANAVFARELDQAEREDLSVITDSRMELAEAYRELMVRTFEQLKAFAETDEERSDIENEFQNAVADIEGVIREIAEGRSARAADLDEIAETAAAEAEDKERDRIDEGRKAAEKALRAAHDLAKKAKTQEARAKFLEQALAEIKKILAFGMAEAELDYGEGGEDNAEAFQSRLAAINTEYNDNLRTSDNIRGSKLGGGGGGGGGKKTDPIKEWIDAASSQVNATNLAVTEGFFQPGQAVDSIEKTLEEARVKMGTITSQIEALRSRAMNGQLTSDEQKRLNTLVEQHGNLNKFVADQQERLINLKYQEGDLIGGLSLQVKQFAVENLDLFTTMQDGIGNLLGSLTGALNEFFTSWANGTKTGKEAFAGLVVGVLKGIQQIFVQMLAVYMVQRLLGMLMPGAGIPQQSFGQIAGGMFGAKKEGGKINYAAAGEKVEGNISRDSKPYMLMPGEYVLRKSAAQAVGYDTLDEMNAMGNRAFASSGHKDVAAPAEKKLDRTMNLYLVDERSQATGSGPQDIIAVISDDISRGGTVKKLIKSVSLGQM